MSAHEADEKELIELYRQYRLTPRPTPAGADGHGSETTQGARGVFNEESALRPEEQVIVDDYRSYRNDRVHSESEQISPELAEADLIESIVDQCIPVIDRSQSSQPAARHETSTRIPSRSLFEMVSQWYRNVLDYLLAPSGAVVATAVVAGLVLFPMLSGDQSTSGLVTFSGSDAYSEELALDGLSAYYPQSVTRNSTLPGRASSRAYHYNIGRLVAGLAIAIKGGNVERGTLFSTQLARMIETDPDIDSAPLVRIQQLWSKSTEDARLSDTISESLNSDFDLFIDNLNARKLTSTEKSFEHLGAWTLGSRIVVTAAIDEASVNQDLYARFVDDFAKLSEKIQKTPDLLTKQRRSLTAFAALIQDSGSVLSESSRQRLLSVSESLDEIHIAYKN